MKHEVMVYIMAIHLAMGTRFAGVGGGFLKKIKTNLLPIWPTTPPTLILSPLLSSI